MNFAFLLLLMNLVWAMPLDPHGPSRGPSGVSFNFDFSGCTSHDAKIEDLAKKALRDIEVLHQSINRYQSRKDLSRELQTKLQNIEKIVLCISRKIPEVRYNCDSEFAKKKCKRLESSAFSDTVPSPAITLCGPYWAYEEKFQRAVLVHEVSHLCGTDDIDYFSYDYKIKYKPKDYAVAVNPFYLLKGHKDDKGIFILNRAHLNADSYEYWVRKSFCLPGYDCK